jgi:hypothetical protein
MSGYGRQGIDSTAFDSLLTMSNSTIKLVLIFKIFWSAKKSNTNVVREVFSGPPTNQLSCRKIHIPYSNVNNYFHSLFLR